PSASNRSGRTTSNGSRGCAPRFSRTHYVPTVSRWISMTCTGRRKFVSPAISEALNHVLQIIFPQRRRKDLIGFGAVLRKGREFRNAPQFRLDKTPCVPRL